MARICVIACFNAIKYSKLGLAEVTQLPQRHREHRQVGASLGVGQLGEQPLRALERGRVARLPGRQQLGGAARALLQHVLGDRALQPGQVVAERGLRQGLPVAVGPAARRSAGAAARGRGGCRCRRAPRSPRRSCAAPPRRPRRHRVRRRGGRRWPRAGPAAAARRPAIQAVACGDAAASGSSRARSACTAGMKRAERLLQRLGQAPRAQEPRRGARGEPALLDQHLRLHGVGHLVVERLDLLPERRRRRTPRALPGRRAPPAPAARRCAPPGDARRSSRRG